MKVKPIKFFLLLLVLLSHISIFSCQQPDDPIIEEEFDWQKALIKSEIPLHEDKEPECIGSPRIDHEQPYDPEMYREQHLDSTAKIFNVNVSQFNPAFVAYQCHYPIYTKEGHFYGYEGAFFIMNLEKDQIILKLDGFYACDFGGNLALYNTKDGLILFDCENFTSQNLGHKSLDAFSPGGKYLAYFNWDDKKRYVLNIENGLVKEQNEPIDYWLTDSTYLARRNRQHYAINYHTKDSTHLGGYYPFGTIIQEISPNDKFITNGSIIYNMETFERVYLPQKRNPDTGWCWNNIIHNFTFFPDNSILGIKVLYYPDNETMEAKVTCHMHIFSGPDFTTETHVELNLETER
jgi:hypothetical protein